MKKPTDYSLLREQLAAMTGNERDTIANLANASALLFMSLDHINWAGFYLARACQLVLGPFQGLPVSALISERESAEPRRRMILPL